VAKLCIYHGNCADGFGSAWVVRKRFGEDDVEFHAGVYQNPPPDVTDRDVILVDFSYSYDALVEMSWKARSILILDHHKSAADALKRLPWAGKHYAEFYGDTIAQCQSNNMPHIAALFDMDKSGAGLTWDYFFPETPRPHLIDIIEDRDLWRFKIPHTRAVQTVVFSHPYDFKTWDWLVARAGNPMSLQEMMNEGDGIDRKHFKDIDELLKVTTRRLKIGGHDVPVANLPYTMSSDAGHKMAQGEHFAACYWDTPEGRVFSLRSADDGMDVSEIAKQYGGGGHKHAAGFRIALDTDP
jgi:oligoribonuclease NrnB/cAMP/cGMP phosphodiesterase (DHH superfamily)